MWDKRAGENSLRDLDKERRKERAESEKDRAQIDSRLARVRSLKPRAQAAEREQESTAQGRRRLRELPRPQWRRVAGEGEEGGGASPARM